MNEVNFKSHRVQAQEAFPRQIGKIMSTLLSSLAQVWPCHKQNS